MFFLIKGIVRIGIFYGKRKTLREFMESVLKCTADHENDPAMRETVAFYAKQTYLQSIFFVSLFVSCGILALTYSLPFIFLNGELSLPFGFIIPGIDYTTHPGFELNFAYQTIQVLFTASGLAAAHLCNIFLVLSGCLRLEIFMIKLQQISDRLFEHEKADPYNLHHIDLTGIIKLHQEILV